MRPTMRATRGKPSGPLTSLFRQQSVSTIRIAMLILLLASVLLTLLYIDFTDEDRTGRGGLRTVEAPGVEETGRGRAAYVGEDEGETEVDGEGDEGEGEGEGDEGGGRGEDTEGGGRQPEIINIEPFHGPANGGVTITVHGRFFMGLGEWTTSAFIDGKRCTSSDVLNYETLLCGLPPGVGGGLSVGIQKTVGAKVLASPENTLFSYDAPVVERVVPDHAPTSGGITITIFGTNFGQLDHVVPEVLIGDALCTGVSLQSDNELACVAPPGNGGSTRVQVSVGGEAHKVESHKTRNQFSYILTPKEKMQQESSMLLDGLQVRYQSLPVFLHKKGLTGLYEFSHKDLFTGRTITYSVTPDLMELLPHEDLKQAHSTCAVVLSSGSLLQTSFGADIDAADAVFRFNNAPTEGFRNEVGARTTYRLLQTVLVRSMIQRMDPDAARHAWKPQPQEKLVMLSEYAQDLFVLLHRMNPHLELLVPSAALMGNINTLYSELRRRFVDMGIEGEQAREAAPSGGVQHGTAGEDSQSYVLRRRLAQHISMARLARLAQERNQLKEVEPVAGTGVSPPSMVGILLAVQMCAHVDVFGFDEGPFRTGAGAGASSYYANSPGAMGVFDLSNSRPSEMDAEMLPLDNAIIELLEIAKFVRIRS